MILTDKSCPVSEFKFKKIQPNPTDIASEPNVNLIYYLNIVFALA